MGQDRVGGAGCVTKVLLCGGGAGDRMAIYLSACGPGSNPPHRLMTNAGIKGAGAKGAPCWGRVCGMYKRRLP
jgi:hypothetical protein